MNTSSQPFDLLIRNGRVVTAAGERQADVGVREGKIAAVEPGLQSKAAKVIDAAGWLVLPGVIDPHTHMGIPIKDTTSADDFASGSEAAACGGVTTIFDFTVQEKGQSLQEALDVRLQKARGRCSVDYGIHVNVTDAPERWLDQIPELIAAGFRSFKVFSTYREAGMMVTWEQFRRILQQVHAHGGLLLLHAEDNELVESQTAANLNAGRLAPIFHARSRTAEAEAKAVQQAAEIAGELGARLYIVHLSSRAGLEAGLRAREQGVDILLETCPQYLVLDESKYEQPNGHYFITTPPLRTREDAEALWQALRDGHSDTVGTDHCPFTRAQKEFGGGEFHRTPNGLPGVETLLPLLYTYGVAEGRIALQRMVQVLAKRTAEIFGLADRKGDIHVGADADLLIWNPNEETAVAAEQLHGHADWSPYEGMRIAGRVEYTILRGQVLVEQGEWVGERGRGALLRR